MEGSVLEALEEDQDSGSQAMSLDRRSWIRATSRKCSTSPRISGPGVDRIEEKCDSALSL